jgi:hypothetical protein
MLNEVRVSLDNGEVDATIIVYLFVRVIEIYHRSID